MSSGTSKRYPPELRERAVRMVAEIRHEHGSEWAAIESVAGKLGIGSAQTLNHPEFHALPRFCEPAGWSVTSWE